ncbi:MAG: hypothetical protein AAGF24_06855 [Cyanobacteria bacterium P01_H01_bin.121]
MPKKETQTAKDENLTDYHQRMHQELAQLCPLKTGEYLTREDYETTSPYLVDKIERVIINAPKQKGKPKFQFEIGLRRLIGGVPTKKRSLLLLAHGEPGDYTLVTVVSPDGKFHSGDRVSFMRPDGKEDEGEIQYFTEEGEVVRVDSYLVMTEDIELVQKGKGSQK